MATRHVRSQTEQISVRVHTLHIHRITAVQTFRIRQHGRLRKHPSGRIQSKNLTHLAVKLPARQSGDLRPKTMPDQCDAGQPIGPLPQKARQCGGHHSRICRGHRVLAQRQMAPVHRAKCAAHKALIGVRHVSHPAPIGTVEPSVYQDGKLRSSASIRRGRIGGEASSDHDKLSIDTGVYRIMLYVLMESEVYSDRLAIAINLHTQRVCERDRANAIKMELK